MSHASGANDNPPAIRATHCAVAASRLFGLYPASQFRVTDGRCGDCPSIRQALWYFRQETIAVPLHGLPLAAFTSHVSAIEDVRAWALTQSAGAPLHLPPLVWIAAPHVFDHALLAPDARRVQLEHEPPVPLHLTPKIALNRAYFDASSAVFFAQRLVKVRGTSTNDAIVARTLWPEDFRLTPAAAYTLERSLPRAESLRALVRAEPRGGAQSPFASFTLWQREQSIGTPAGPRERAVIGILLNGAQGDDDEAHGGHFALLTGRTRHDGAIGDWLVNNFYPLDIESEKGILPAPLPLDNYLADLNSGQSYYRPSYLMVAVLSDARAPTLLQNALNRVYNQFYRHQLVYQHATMNCAGISVDVLRALGWAIGTRRSTKRWLAGMGFPYFLLTQRSLTEARTTHDYLVEDHTRLLPAAAFEEIGASLLEMVDDGSRGAAAGGNAAVGLANMIAADAEAIMFVRIPQFPSNRSWGDAPAVTTAEYQARLPADRDAMQIVPVPARPFPAELRDPDLRAPPRRRSDVAAMTWAVVVLAGALWLAWRRWSR